MAKRKTLPKDFGDMLTTASLDELTAVFDTCALGARGGYGKSTAIGFIECPDDLIVWLVGQGLDVDASDTYDASPLHWRASTGRAEQMPLLLSLGADIHRPDTYGESPLHAAAGAPRRVDAARILLENGADPRGVNAAGETPLLYGLRRTQNGHIPEMASLAPILLAAGDEITDDMSEAVTRIAAQFEFHRAGFNPDYLAETDAGLSELYRIFGVEPVAGRRLHDGVSPIIAPPGAWQDQHQALWELLIPSTGPAATVQGEVIRITGKTAREILDNGSPNWDQDFTRMLASLPDHFATGDPLPEAELSTAHRLAHALRGGKGDDDEVNAWASSRSSG